MIAAHHIEPIAIALYESDCRRQAGDMARRTVLSRVRAFYGFPDWCSLEPRQRASWRAQAVTMLAEVRAQRDEAEAWEAHAA